MEAGTAFGWEERPGCALHGHAIATKEEATRLGFPCSAHATVFSTREDKQAMMELLAQHPYPRHKIFVRQGHGFFLLEGDVESAVRLFDELILPNMAVVESQL